MSSRLDEAIEHVRSSEAAKLELQKPRMYRVLLLNDDYTPMDFVIGLLKYFFGMHEEAATYTMLQVHREGKGVCGIFTREIAETKVALVSEYARKHEHPLLCEMEPV